MLKSSIRIYRHFKSSQKLLSDVNIFVDGIPITVDSSLTVMQACQKAGVIIPHFCFHERLAIAGNCRMCILEIEKINKPIASCA